MCAVPLLSGEMTEILEVIEFFCSITGHKCGQMQTIMSQHVMAAACPTLESGSPNDARTQQDGADLINYNKIRRIQLTYTATACVLCLQRSWMLLAALAAGGTCNFQHTAAQLRECPRTHDI
jgi:hypothetical protein